MYACLADASLVFFAYCLFPYLRGVYIRLTSINTDVNCSSVTSMQVIHARAKRRGAFMYVVSVRIFTFGRRDTDMTKAEQHPLNATCPAPVRVMWHNRDFNRLKTASGHIILPEYGFLICKYIRQNDCLDVGRSLYEMSAMFQRRYLCVLLQSLYSSDIRWLVNIIGDIAQHCKTILTIFSGDFVKYVRVHDHFIWYIVVYKLIKLKCEYIWLHWTWWLRSIRAHLICFKQHRKIEGLLF